MSADFSDFSRWNLEKTLSDYFLQNAIHVKYYTDFGDMYQCSERAQIMKMVEGDIIVWFDDAKKRGAQVVEKAISYDVIAGEIKQIDDTDYRYS